MKKLFMMIAGTFLLLHLNACGKSVMEDIALRYPDITVNTTNLIQGYFIHDERITFVFDEELWEVESPEMVEVRGTFSGWKHSDDYIMEHSSSANVWYLDKSIEEIDVPANSGQPEFKFVVDDSWLQPLEELPLGYLCGDGYNGYNLVILFPGDDPADIAEINVLKSTVRTNYDSDEQMANFREIILGDIAPGTLYRSYNPIIASKTDHPLEEERIAMVQRLMEENGIQSVINLSETESDLEEADVPVYYQTVIDEGNITLVESGYKEVYFQSDSEEFAEKIAGIVRFINSHSAPYLIHCRLGTDRTGVISAVLEAFMGATWAEMKEDYLKSNNLGVKEYRSDKLLEYSFENMLNIELSDDSVISNEMTEYLKTSAGLSDEELTSLSSKLKGE